jgi:2-dehydropantoate 2-reductase
MKKKLRVTVVGGGSVGMAMAATLALAGVDVVMLVRTSSMALLRRDGIGVTGVSGVHAVAPDSITIDDAQCPDVCSLECDVMIMATKAYQVAEVMTSIVSMTRDTPGPRSVLLLQNGWGSADEARAIMPADVGIFSSIMMIGIERRSTTQVNINVQAGPVRIGTLFDGDSTAIQSLVAVAGQGFLPMVYEDKIEPAILNKFLFNTCLNATGALTGQTYGELIKNAHSRSLIIHLANETIRVLAATHGYQAAENGLHYVEAMLTPFVIPKAAAHRSSMLQDVEVGRRTEIDYLNGAVVRMGRSKGIATPFNEAILSLVHAAAAAS